MTFVAARRGVTKDLAVALGSSLPLRLAWVRRWDRWLHFLVGVQMGTVVAVASVAHTAAPAPAVIVPLGVLWLGPAVCRRLALRVCRRLDVPTLAEMAAGPQLRSGEDRTAIRVEPVSWVVPPDEGRG